MVSLLPDAVTDLDGFVGVHGRQQIDALQDVHIFISLLDGCILDNVIERSSIQSESNRISLSLNRCCSRSVVKKSQFTKWFSRLISLYIFSKMLILLGRYLQRPWRNSWNNPILPSPPHTSCHHLLPTWWPNHPTWFINHTKCSLEMLLIHRIDNNIAFLILQRLEHEGLHQPLDDAVLGIPLLGDHAGHKFLIIIYV